MAVSCSNISFSFFLKEFLMEQLEVKKIGNRHPITVRLIKLLKTGVPGDEFTDQQLSKIATVDITVKPNYLYSAIKYLERSGIIWRRIPKSGTIRCLNDIEKTECCEQAVKHIRKTAKRSSKVLAFVKPDNLPNDKKASAMALSAQLGAITLFSKKDTAVKLGNEQSVPKIGDVMKIFK